MKMISQAARVALIGFAIAIGGAAQAATAYDESVSGDLSDSGATPTLLAFALGDNQIFGTTGRDDTVDRDYFSFTISSGYVLNAITVLPGTTAIGPAAKSFIGIEAGSAMTVLPTATDAVGLLGWRHYGPDDINTDILDDMAIPAGGSSGFNTPLGAGIYSVWVQETGMGSVNYGLNFQLAAVPEPATWAMMIIGFGAIGGTIRRRRWNIGPAGAAV